jgi:hypothetical protein
MLLVLRRELVAADEKRGWCVRASLQDLGFAARSARSHCSWADPAEHETIEQLELSA